MTFLASDREALWFSIVRVNYEMQGGWQADRPSIPGQSGPLPLVSNIRFTHFQNLVLLCGLDWNVVDCQHGLGPDWFAVWSGWAPRFWEALVEVMVVQSIQVFNLDLKVSRSNIIRKFVLALWCSVTKCCFSVFNLHSGNRQPNNQMTWGPLGSDVKRQSKMYFGRKPLRDLPDKQ